MLTAVAINNHLSVSVSVLDRHIEERNGDKQQSTPKDLFAGAAAVDDQASPGGYQPDCNKQNDADLCAQRRMADAAEDQAWYTAAAFWVLVATLGAAFWAAFEARRAARAGIEINALTERNAQQQLRAYLDIFEISKIKTTGNPANRFVAVLTVRNAGQTPAKNMYSCLQFDVAQGVELKLPGIIVIGPGIQREITINSPILESWTIHEVGLGKMALRLWGTIHYTDVFGDEHVNTLAYSIRNDGSTWNITPENEGNDAT